MLLPILYGGKLPEGTNMPRPCIMTEIESAEPMQQRNANAQVSPLHPGKDLSCKSVEMLQEKVLNQGKDSLVICPTQALSHNLPNKCLEIGKAKSLQTIAEDICFEKANKDTSFAVCIQKKGEMSVGQNARAENDETDMEENENCQSLINLCLICLAEAQLGTTILCLPESFLNRPLASEIIFPEKAVSLDQGCSASRCVLERMSSRQKLALCSSNQGAADLVWRPMSLSWRLTSCAGEDAQRRPVEIKGETKHLEEENGNFNPGVGETSCTLSVYGQENSQQLLETPPLRRSENKTQPPTTDLNRTMKFQLNPQTLLGY